jgi:outer membrane protein assembly factor BamB
VGEEDWAKATATGPDGGTVYVAGAAATGSDDRDLLTVALDADTGDTDWITAYGGPDHDHDAVEAIAATPDGELIVVTGRSWAEEDPDVATVAYETETGDQQWVDRFDTEHVGGDAGRALAVGPGGERVYVVARSEGARSAGSPVRASTADLPTIALDTDTGEQAWAARYNGEAGLRERPEDVAVGPDGERVHAAGRSVGFSLSTDAVLVAYESTPCLMDRTPYVGRDRNLGVDNLLRPLGTAGRSPP